MSVSRNILITGAVGFIGAALTIRLVERGETVIGIDNLNNYYDSNLKKLRLLEIEKSAKKSKGNFHFFLLSIENKEKLDEIFQLHLPKNYYKFGGSSRR